jgi:beta-glucosidase
VFLTGRPLWISPELEAADAFLVAWLPGTEGGGIADVLFRGKDGKVSYNFTGKLSYSWPRDPSQTALNRDDADTLSRGGSPAGSPTGAVSTPLFPYGFGLSY